MCTVPYAYSARVTYVWHDIACYSMVLASHRIMPYNVCRIPYGYVSNYITIPCGVNTSQQTPSGGEAFPCVKLGSPRLVLRISCFLTEGLLGCSRYFYPPKSARAYLFPQSVKIICFCSGPISVDPICPQPKYASFPSWDPRFLGLDSRQDLRLPWHKQK